eukprot:scaffold531639_cov34-Prasinocladus_malaysianus.AAC.1
MQEDTGSHHQHVGLVGGLGKLNHTPASTRFSMIYCVFSALATWHSLDRLPMDVSFRWAVVSCLRYASLSPDTSYKGRYYVIIASEITSKTSNGQGR